MRCCEAEAVLPRCCRRSSHLCLGEHRQPARLLLLPPNGAVRAAPKGRRGAQRARRGQQLGHFKQLVPQPIDVDHSTRDRLLKAFVGSLHSSRLS